jgi:hypothetical protein
LHAISPVGTKFSAPQTEGPQGQKNIYASSKPLGATIYFKFGD